MGDLAQFIEKNYGALCLNVDPPPHSVPLTPFINLDNDLKNFLKKAVSSPTNIRKLLKGIKGIGGDGPDILVRHCSMHLAMSGTIHRS